MVREKIKVSDYRKICLKNDYFLWNFLQKKQNINELSIWSIFDEKPMIQNIVVSNDIKELLDIIPINYYESFVEDSMDFLLDLGLKSSDLFELPPTFQTRIAVRTEFLFKPIVFLFKKFIPVSSTVNYGYHVEGITKMIIDYAPSIIEKIELD